MFARGFTGHEHLPEFNLINMNGRVYDPILGKFLSPDNYIQMPDYTQNLNRYSYCLNNPLMYTDPDGESFLLALGLSILGNYVIGWLDNVINKEMSAKEALRNTNFVMGINFSPADFNNQNRGISNSQVNAHNMVGQIAAGQQNISGQLAGFSRMDSYSMPELSLPTEGFVGISPLAGGVALTNMNNPNVIDLSSSLNVVGQLVQWGRYINSLEGGQYVNVKDIYINPRIKSSGEKISEIVFGGNCSYPNYQCGTSKYRLSNGKRVSADWAIYWRYGPAENNHMTWVSAKAYNDGSQQIRFMGYGQDGNVTITTYNLALYKYLKSKIYGK